MIFTIAVVVRLIAGARNGSQSSSGIGGISGERYLFGATHGGELNSGAGLSVGSNGISVYEHGSAYARAGRLQPVAANEFQYRYGYLFCKAAND